MILKKIGVWSASKIHAIIMAIFGLFLGIVFFAASKLAPSQPSSSALANLGALGIIVLPLLYSAIGLLIGAISAFIYNIVAKRVGGIELHFDK